LRGGGFLLAAGLGLLLRLPPEARGGRPGDVLENTGEGMGVAEPGNERDLRHVPLVGRRQEFGAGMGDTVAVDVFLDGGVQVFADGGGQVIDVAADGACQVVAAEIRVEIGQIAFHVVLYAHEKPVPLHFGEFVHEVFHVFALLLFGGGGRFELLPQLVVEVLVVAVIDGDERIESGEQEVERRVVAVIRDEAEAYGRDADAQRVEKDTGGPIQFQPFRRMEDCLYVAEVDASLAQEEAGVYAELHDVGQPRQGADQQGRVVDVGHPGAEVGRADIVPEQAGKEVCGREHDHRQCMPQDIAFRDAPSPEQEKEQECEQERLRSGDEDDGEVEQFFDGVLAGSGAKDGDVPCRHEPGGQRQKPAGGPVPGDRAVLERFQHQQQEAVDEADEGCDRGCGKVEQLVCHGLISSNPDN